MKATQGRHQTNKHDSSAVRLYSWLLCLQAIGFDMDYTLAQYKPDTFETLAHEQTIDKLVTYFGYPAELYDLTFDWRYMTRGLIIDKVCEMATEDDSALLFREDRADLCFGAGQLVACMPVCACRVTACCSGCV